MKTNDRTVPKTTWRIKYCKIQVRHNTGYPASSTSNVCKRRRYLRTSTNSHQRSIPNSIYSAIVGNSNTAASAY